MAPKMPGLCTPGLVWRKNKTKWPRLFKVGIRSPQGETAKRRVQVCRSPAQASQVDRKGEFAFLLLHVIDFREFVLIARLT